MKGIVFTEFLDIVEEKIGPERLEELIAASSLPNAGAYTSVGTYDHAEILRMVEQLSLVTGVDRPRLLLAFGEHLFHRLAAAHPQFFAGLQDAFALLSRVGPHIHHEVLKLYPEAELPSIETFRLDSRRLELIYRSSRPFGDLAEGLIQGCISHFRVPMNLTREDLSVSAGQSVRFTISMAD